MFGLPPGLGYREGTRASKWCLKAETTESAGAPAQQGMWRKRHVSCITGNAAGYIDQWQSYLDCTGLQPHRSGPHVQPMRVLTLSFRVPRTMPSAMIHLWGVGHMQVNVSV